MSESPLPANSRPTGPESPGESTPELRPDVAAQPATDDVRAGSGAMFDRIACRYDRLNRVLSLGLDRGWRKAAVRALNIAASARVLDVATGTGDLALDLLRRHPEAEVDGLDPAANMLAIAERKATTRDVRERFRVHVGDAQDLPFADDTFDGATIAFGIRNVPDRELALREMTRAVKPGGRVVVLELTEPRGWGPVALGARVWVRQVVPRLGAWLSSREEYRYLQQSIAAFPPPARFAEIMRESGLTDVTVRRLGLGSVGLFVGVVPAAG